MNNVYSKEGFIIFPVSDGFIVQNKAKEFEEGHTHLKSFEVAKTVIDLAIKKKIPRSKSIYLLISLIRVSTDKEYIEKLEDLVERKRERNRQQTRKKKGFNK